MTDTDTGPGRFRYDDDDIVAFEEWCAPENEVEQVILDGEPIVQVRHVAPKDYAQGLIYVRDGDILIKGHGGIILHVYPGPGEGEEAS